jgi:hypothetical protein
MIEIRIKRGGDSAAILTAHNSLQLTLPLTDTGTDRRMANRELRMPGLGQMRIKHPAGQPQQRSRQTTKDEVMPTVNAIGIGHK